MRGILPLIALLVLLPFCGGCVNTPQGWTTADIAHPGSEAQQQNRAMRYEPYPEVEMGPAVVGSRPREYQEPLPDVTRALMRGKDSLVAPYPDAPMAQPPLQQPSIICPQPVEQTPIQQPVISSPPAAAFYNPPAATGGSLQP